jgi:hypothetical protein
MLDASAYQHLEIGNLVIQRRILPTQNHGESAPSASVQGAKGFRISIFTLFALVRDAPTGIPIPNVCLAVGRIRALYHARAREDEICALLLLDRPGFAPGGIPSVELIGATMSVEGRGSTKRRKNCLRNAEVS